MYWIILPFRRCLDFSGRSRRKEFWLFTLFTTLIALIWVLAVVGITGSPSTGASELAEKGIAVWIVVIILPAIAVQVRRFHDLDKSGWFCLIGMIPSIGALIILFYMSREGMRADNRFGPDPKELDDDVAT